MAIITDTGFTAEVDTQALNRLLSISDLDKKREKEIKKLIEKALFNARKRMSEKARGMMQNSKKASWRAIKYDIYDSILGGNISIFSRKRAGAKYNLPPSTRGRSETTERLASYLGRDRSFVLRIMNAANTSRTRISSTMNNHPIWRTIENRPSRYYISNTIGYRGVWGSHGNGSWGSVIDKHIMDDAARELSQLLCDELVKGINNY